MISVIPERVDLFDSRHTHLALWGGGREGGRGAQCREWALGWRMSLTCNAHSEYISNNIL